MRPIKDFIKANSKKITHFIKDITLSFVMFYILYTSLLGNTVLLKAYENLELILSQNYKFVVILSVIYLLLYFYLEDIKMKMEGNENEKIIK